MGAVHDARRCPDSGVEPNLTEDERLRIHDNMQADENHRLHATNSGYKVYRCRCLACKQYWNERARLNREKAKQGEVPVEQHGTITGYTYYGCRCDMCVLAKVSERHTHRTPEQNRDRARRRRHRMASNKSIANGLIAKYVGPDRKEVYKLLENAAQAARADERDVTMRKLREKREWITQSPADNKLERIKKQWTLKAIDSLLSVI